MQCFVCKESIPFEEGRMLPLILPPDHPDKAPGPEDREQFFPVCYRCVPKGEEDVELPWLAP